MTGEPGGWRRRDRALATIVGGAYLVTLLAAAGVEASIITLVRQAAFMAPGVFLFRVVAPGNWLVAWAFGPLVGYALSTTVSLAAWAAGARGPWILLVAPLVAATLARPLRHLRDAWAWPQPAAADVRAVLLVLCLVPLVVARPFSQVGAMRPEGRVYRAYFTADYVWRRAIVAELAKGQFPPANPYYTRDPLHYYWMAHLPAAIEYRAVGDAAELDDLLLAGSIAVDAGFVLAVYGLTRLVVSVPWAASGGVWWAFLLTSLEGLAGLWQLHNEELPLDLVRVLNIDAVTRWYYSGMPIDGLHRILWYQPHHATAYVLGFIALALVACRRERRAPGVFLAAGAVLGVDVMVSSFVAFMATAAIAVYEGAAVIWRRAWGDALLNVAWASLPMMAGVAVMTELQYIDHQPGALNTIRFGINPLSVNHPLVATFLSAGPILLVAGAGAVAAVRAREATLWPFVAAIVNAVVFYFYVDVRDHEDVYVGWRVGHTVFIALAPFVGLTLLAVSRLSQAQRRLGWAALAMVGVTAAPMVLIDAYNTQDVTNQAPGPSFNWTLVLSPPELEGLDWIRTHTGQDARVQVDAYSRETNTWAYIPAFAERRMAVGLPLGLVPLEKYKQGSLRMRWLYDAPDPMGVFELAALSGIDYIVVGPPERKDHPGVEARYARAADVLPQVFHNDALSVYEVLRPGHHR